MGKNNQVTWAQAFRDIIITAMNRGQLLLISLIGLIFFLVSKMSEDTTDKLINDMIKNLTNISFLAYILCILLIIGWYTTCKTARRMHSEECERIGKEKSKLQEELLKQKRKGA